MHLQHYKKQKYCYKFSSAEDLLSNIENLYKSSVSQNKLYLHKKFYYLIFDEKPTCNKLVFNEIFSVSNYIESYLQEYGKLISTNAVKEIGSKL